MLCIVTKLYHIEYCYSLNILKSKSANLEKRTKINEMISILQRHVVALTFTLLLISREVRSARFQSKASITDTVITAWCVDARCILTANLFLLTFVDICISGERK